MVDMRVDLDFVGMTYEVIMAQYPDSYEEEDFVIIGDVYGEGYELYFENGVCVESEYFCSEE